MPKGCSNPDIPGPSAWSPLLPEKQWMALIAGPFRFAPISVIQTAWMASQKRTEPHNSKPAIF
jgi:hypothetical protein